MVRKTCMKPRANNLWWKSRPWCKYARAPPGCSSHCCAGGAAGALTQAKPSKPAHMLAVPAAQPALAPPAACCAAISMHTCTHA